MSSDYGGVTDPLILSVQLTTTSSIFSVDQVKKHELVVNCKPKALRPSFREREKKKLQKPGKYWLSYESISYLTEEDMQTLTLTLQLEFGVRSIILTLLCCVAPSDITFRQQSLIVFGFMCTSKQ